MLPPSSQLSFPGPATPEIQTTPPTLLPPSPQPTNHPCTPKSTLFFSLCSYAHYIITKREYLFLPSVSGTYRYLLNSKLLPGTDMSYTSIAVPRTLYNNHPYFYRNETSHTYPTLASTLPHSRYQSEAPKGMITHPYRYCGLGPAPL